MVGLVHGNIELQKAGHSNVNSTQMVGIQIPIVNKGLTCELTPKHVSLPNLCGS